MKNIILQIALLLSLSPIAAFADKNLSKDNIIILFMESESAINERNVDKMLEFYAESYRVDIFDPAELGGNRSFNKEDYRRAMKKTWNESKNLDYKFKYDELNIEIASDKQTATVKTKTHSYYSFNGKRLVDTTSNCFVKVVLENQRPKLAYTRLEFLRSN